MSKKSTNKGLNLETIFIRLGLPKNASVIYDILSKHESLLAHNVIKSSGVQRPSAYRALYELEKIGLAFRRSKGKRNYWSAASSEKVKKVFENEISLIPDRFSDGKVKAKVDESVTNSMRLLHGPEGIRRVFDDVIEHLSNRSTFYRYTSEKDLDKVNSYLSSDYRKRRDTKHLERLVISNPVSGNRKKARLERFIKYIPPTVDLFDQNIIQLVYGDRIAFIDLNKEESFIIENKELADFQKVILNSCIRSYRNRLIAQSS